MHKSWLVVWVLSITLALSVDEEVFPTKDEYVALADSALKELKELTTGDLDQTWPDLEREEDGIKIYTKESPFPEIQEKILYVQTIANAPAEKVRKLLEPQSEYRIKWDDLYEFVKLIDRPAKNVFVFHEAVHSMLLLAARDAVVVCKDVEEDGDLWSACRSTTHKDGPEDDDHVRTVKRLTGYRLIPNLNDNTTDVRLVFGADLNLKVGFFSSLANRFKPGQLVDFVGRLNQAVQDFRI